MSTYENDCVPALASCNSLTGENSACENAENTCYNDIEGPLSESADFDVYDVREPSNDPYPPETYATYLTQSSVVKAIGAQSTYQECPNAPYNKFSATGDDSRSLLSTLSTVVQSGIKVTLFAGDADFICNWYGNQDVANSLTFSQQTAFRAASLAPYTVNGVQNATFKTAGNLGFVRVFGAGHEVPYYQPQVAFQIFKQTLSGSGLKST